MFQRFLKYNIVFFDLYRVDVLGMFVIYDIKGKYEELF